VHDSLKGDDKVPSMIWSSTEAVQHLVPLHKRYHEDLIMFAMIATSNRLCWLTEACEVLLLLGIYGHDFIVTPCGSKDIVCKSAGAKETPCKHSQVVH